MLAAAGIKRQGLDQEKDLIYEQLKIEDVLPAAGQVIIAVETLESGLAYDMMQTISDKTTQFTLMIERAVLGELGASCHEPIGVYATTSKEDMELWVMRYEDGKVMKKKVCGKKCNWNELIHQLCEK